MKKLKGIFSHQEREVAELSIDRELAAEYLKAGMESLDNPDDHAADVLALRTVADASFSGNGRKRNAAVGEADGMHGLDGGNTVSFHPHAADQVVLGEGAVALHPDSLAPRLLKSAILAWKAGFRNTIS